MTKVGVVHPFGSDMEDGEQQVPPLRYAPDFVVDEPALFFASHADSRAPMVRKLRASPALSYSGLLEALSHHSCV
jgi:hypothetical protein